MIIEVPNLYLYPSDPAGLFLHEHVNHFSPTSLMRLALDCGLATLRFSQLDCSRPFGFVAVFEKSDLHFDTNRGNSSAAEILMAQYCMSEGRYLIESYYLRLKEARKRILKKDHKVIIWGANGICSQLLDNFCLPQSVLVVDSDPRKKNFLAPIHVYQPDELVDEIREADLVVINTRLHSGEIEAWITEQTGRTLSNDARLVLDYLE